MERETILLLGHGSRDFNAIVEFTAFITLFKAETRRSLVFPAFLELASPSIPEAIQQAVSAGAKRIIAVPLFLFSGRHVLEDLPRILSESRAAFSGIELFYGKPLGLHPSILELAAERIHGSSPPRPDDDQSGLLVVGRGTLEPMAINETARFTEQLAHRLSRPRVRHCFAEVSPPFLPGALETILILGVKAVTIFPALLFTGIIIQRIQHQVAQQRKRYPGVSLSLAPYLGVHPLLVEAVQDQIAAAGAI